MQCSEALIRIIVSDLINNQLDLFIVDQKKIPAIWPTKWIWSGLIITQSHLIILSVDLDSRPGKQQLYERVVPPHLVGNKARFKDVTIFNFQPKR